MRIGRFNWNKVNTKEIFPEKKKADKLETDPL
jgi:hypothetical protein